MPDSGVDQEPDAPGDITRHRRVVWVVLLAFLTGVLCISKFHFGTDSPVEAVATLHLAGAAAMGLAFPWMFRLGNNDMCFWFLLGAAICAEINFSPRLVPSQGLLRLAVSELSGGKDSGWGTHWIGMTLAVGFALLAAMVAALTATVLHRCGAGFPTSRTMFRELSVRLGRFEREEGGKEP